VPPSTPPPAGGGAGRLPSVPSSAVGGASGAPAATTTGKKGPNWLLIIGIILGVLVLACVLILGVLYWVGQRAAQSLGTAVAATAASIGEPPASTDFPNVLLRDSLASEATSQFTAGQRENGDSRFENGAFVSVAAISHSARKHSMKDREWFVSPTWWCVVGSASDQGVCVV
jgi:hypothetical protein